MRVLPYEEAKAEATRFFEESLGENEALTDWDLSFQEYIEEHKVLCLRWNWKKWAEELANGVWKRRPPWKSPGGIIAQNRKWPSYASI
jgi:hypothetical protein